MGLVGLGIFVGFSTRIKVWGLHGLGESGLEGTNEKLERSCETAMEVGEKLSADGCFALAG